MQTHKSEKRKKTMITVDYKFGIRLAYPLRVRVRPSRVFGAGMKEGEGKICQYLEPVMN